MVRGKVGVYVKSRGAALITGTATNREFTVMTQMNTLSKEIDESCFKANVAFQ